jgi:hypothetical protein
MVTRLGWVLLFLTDIMLIMGISNEEAARRKKKKEEMEKKKSERKKSSNCNAEERGKTSEDGTHIPYFSSFFCPCPFLCSDIAARAEGPTGHPSKERAQGVNAAGD